MPELRRICGGAAFLGGGETPCEDMLKGTAKAVEKPTWKQSVCQSRKECYQRNHGRSAHEGGCKVSGKWPEVSRKSPGRAKGSGRVAGGFVAKIGTKV